MDAPTHLLLKSIFIALRGLCMLLLTYQTIYAKGVCVWNSPNCQ